MFASVPLPYPLDALVEVVREPTGWMPAVPDPGEERLFAGTLRVLGTEVAVTYAVTPSDPDRDPARWTIAARAARPWLGGFDAQIDLVPE